MFLQRHRYSVLFTAVVLLAWIISTPLPSLGKINLYGFDNPPRIGEAITYPETVSFLQLWSEFMQKDISRYGLLQISLTNTIPSEGFSPQLVRWLKNEGWDADRFFYVEQRLKAAVKTAYLKENLKTNRNILQHMSKHGPDKINYENMLEIVESQEQQLNVEKVRPEELILVSQDLYTIKDVLDGKVVYPREN